MKEQDIMKKEKTAKSPLIKKILMSFLIVAAAFSVFLLLFHVKPLASSFKYELGSPVSRELSDYISGLEWAVNLSKLDLSDVDENSVGRYLVYLSHGPFQKFVYTIDIVDTTPPDVTVYSKTVPIQRMVKYDYTSFVTSFSDLSGEVEFSFADESFDTIRVSDNNKTIVGTALGEREFTLIASDPSQNTTKLKIKVFVDDPPYIEGAEEYYISLGSSVAFTENLTAYDEVDGRIDNIAYIIDEAYLENTGDYDIVYKVLDSFGFEGQCSSRVHVYNPLELQEIINSHKVSGTSQYVVGAINPHDMGISSSNEISEVEKLVTPTLTHIRTDFPDGGYVHGSGFIINICEDEIIVCTNKHVVENRDNMDVYFFDGSKARGDIVSSISIPDIAFISVKKDDIPKKTFDEIRTIHLNTPYFNALPDKPDVDIMIRSNFKSGDMWKFDEGNIVRKSGVLSQYFAGFDYPVTQIELNLVGGMSGSPVVDETGSLICMATYKWFNGSFYEYYGVKVTDIVAYFKEIFGRDADYYIAYQ